MAVAVRGVNVVRVIGDLWGERGEVSRWHGAKRRINPQRTVQRIRDLRSPLARGAEFKAGKIALLPIYGGKYLRSRGWGDAIVAVLVRG